MRLLWQTGAKHPVSNLQFQINLQYFKRFPTYSGPTVRNIRHLCQNPSIGDGQKKSEEELTSEQSQQSKSQGVDNLSTGNHLEAESSRDHDHDPLHSAAHQATHRVSEKVTFSALERIADSLIGRAAQKVGSRAVEQTAAKTAERIGERAIDRAGEHIIDGIITRAAESSGKAAVQHAAEAGVALGLEHASEKAGERILEGVLEKATRQTGIAAARHAAESGVIKGVERAAEEVLPRAGNRAMNSAFERGSMQALERGAEKTLPRAGEMGAVVAGERIAEQAARHVANSGGVRRGLETVLDRVLIRVGRGITIALPALGSLFVLYLVKEDRKRALLEAEKGNMPAARAFWLAFLCDASDVGAHVIIITSLLNVHYSVGPHLPHIWLQTAEYGGLAVAVVSTLSAVVGELLSAGVSWPWWDNRSQKGPQAKI
ncbi:hypothetical protein Ndes2526B_g05726 [Nannochloris sp. 'desiccata']